MSRLPSPHTAATPRGVAPAVRVPGGRLAHTRRLGSPMCPTTYERRLRVARIQHRIGVACLALSGFCVIYMVAQLVRAALS